MVKDWISPLNSRERFSKSDSRSSWWVILWKSIPSNSSFEYPVISQKCGFTVIKHLSDVTRTMPIFACSKIWRKRISLSSNLLNNGFVTRVNRNDPKMIATRAMKPAIDDARINGAQISAISILATNPGSVLQPVQKPPKQAPLDSRSQWLSQIGQKELFSSVLQALNWMVWAVVCQGQGAGDLIRKQYNRHRVLQVWILQSLQNPCSFRGHPWSGLKLLRRLLHDNLHYGLNRISRWLLSALPGFGQLQ